MDVQEIQQALKKIIDDHGSVSFEDSTPMEDSIISLLRDIEWFPIEGEWCWFSNMNRSATVAQFQEQKDGTYIDTEGTEWTHCDKFEGDLPKHLDLSIKSV